MIRTEFIQVDTRGYCDMLDLTPGVERLLTSSGLKEGSVLLFVPGSTAALTTIEYEAGALQDLRDAIERLAPTDITYAHDRRWGDGNGFSHVRAALLGAHLEIPVAGGRLIRGTWQQILLIDFDNGPRQRRVAIQLRGE
ncbi:MAG: secondary thiamine-phosphate synthase enzyme YjbQ [Candidatus Eisenbacteria bacterium]|uniref:Secondary thiamine-phosphate synthase enzyme YjbQ n=1 Tax=Eiseniibacteriota bacterium TaxID=2212470 RepID=A0A948RUP1_UNCEI|nr:secondary thiamine-phosphate synthase enzyme YjbQ [Candidatus Eisenbacteria bacterium]MBU1947165.1 secondary thiamine-phosphate synthase enzyme YjbQ [Candidatus Eisenbacteria bacterium]MBU2691215.1 secondary thiamine-phosphate synthase enzyme YjbQ [Candidatus Eisenbacteria bacterium]